MNVARLFALAVIFISTRVPALSGDFLIHDGDRVVFLGDSITEQRLYTTYIEAYALTRNPDHKMTFRNVGWGGDTSWLRQRARPDERQLFAADEATQQRMVEDAVGRGLGRDVLPLKPTLVTVKFGMNDHSYQPFREDIFRAYTRSQQQIATVLKANGARVAFLTPQPIEEKRPDPNKDTKNESLRKFADGLREVAGHNGTTFIDQFDPYMAMLLRERTGNPDSFIGGGDAVHPGPVGQTVMAWAVLKGMNAPALVSSARINLDSKSVDAQSCRVESLQSANGSLSFERIDEALPMPIDTRAEAAMKLAPILDDLNQYLLQVSSLPDAKYSLKIDGQPIGEFSASALAQGVNLATQAKPIVEQSQQVLDLVFKKNNVFFTRWRSVQLFDFPSWTRSLDVEKARATELARLDQEIAELESQIEAARKPTTHRFELQRTAN